MCSTNQLNRMLKRLFLLAAFCVFCVSDPPKIYVKAHTVAGAGLSSVGSVKMSTKIFD